VKIYVTNQNEAISSIYKLILKFQNIPDLTFHGDKRPNDVYNLIIKKEYDIYIEIKRIKKKTPEL